MRSSDWSSDVCSSDLSEDLKARAREISGGGVGIVVDPVGDRFAEPALRALGWMGRYLVIGFAGGEIPRLPVNQALLNNRSILGVDWGAWTMRDPEGNRALLAELMELAGSGALSPIEPTPYPLDELVTAQIGRASFGERECQYV